ncbi:MAG: DUF1549 and DUF1553 domain-containing protein, partial [Chloroflexi bacterium]|nr:DUF1549 and DUF1553 domain-containing protein [Chloroflexota bacterium]
AVLRRWIDSGAPWPATPVGKTHWAYLKPRRPAVPAVRTPGWVRNPIDSFVLSNLEHEGLTPSPEADRVTLIRRVTLDLTGLPPSPQEVDAFVADRSPNAYDRVVTRLLASSHYGERMALPWLDAARYADSNGFQQDGDTYQYVWRDWVVAALNANMPFDRFTILQLAGDLLPNATTNDKVATGFNRCGMLNGEGGAIPEEQRNNILFDRVDVTATTWLAATLACAQCHDHKYDPFTQRDYYSFLAFFNNVPESGVPPGGGQYRIADPWIYAPDAGQAATLRQFDAEITAARVISAQYEQDHQTGIAAARAAWEAAALAGKSPGAAPSAPILAVLRIPAVRRAPAQAGQIRDAFLSAAAPIGLRLLRERVTALEKQRDAYRDALPQAMVMSDAQLRKSHILSRGNYEMPLAEVHSDTPRSLPPMPPGAPKNRLGLAEWLVSPENPLTARVQVNRYWQLFFGTGLVKTSENLGTQCDPPSNQKLLDWLAVEFRESGWNVKHIQRLIVT